jgi:hypothetical protein
MVFAIDLTPSYGETVEAILFSDYADMSAISPRIADIAADVLNKFHTNKLAKS